MSKLIHAKCYNFSKPIIGRIISFDRAENTTDFAIDEMVSVVVSEDGITQTCSIQNYIISQKTNFDKKIYLQEGINDFKIGDILLIDVHGMISVLFDAESNQNAFFFTEKCNHNCIMCSQPPMGEEVFKDLLEINKKVLSLIPENTEDIGITGGEPTIFWDSFIDFLKILTESLPNTSIHILTNGRTFSDYDKALQISKLNLKNVVLGIPLYSDYFLVHDNIVQSKNAYYDMIEGLYNLARFHIRIEIRFVIMENNYGRLEKLGRFIYKNLPFVEHVAFMGLEPMGSAKTNIHDIWISPDKYISQLERTVSYLNSLDVAVSIYNLPLCIIPDKIKKNYKKAISDWKCVYLDECINCKLQSECGGFFLSAKEIEHEYLIPTYN